MNNIIINSRPASYKEIDPLHYEISSDKTTIKYFLEYSKELSCASQIDNICEKIQYFYNFRNDAIYNNYDLTTPQYLQNRVWMAIQKIIIPFQGKYPENIEVDNEFLQALFQPIIPDSPLLKQSQNKNVNCLIASIVTVGLIAELVFREIVSGVLYLGFCVYSIYNEDDAALYQLRLDLNRHRPYYILSGKFFALIGGYGRC